MWKAAAAAGYTLAEIVIAILVFSVGGLTLAASSAVVVQAMGANALRERGYRIAASKIEEIRAECAIATSGRATVQGIESRWLVVRTEPGTISATESVRYRSASGFHVDTYRATIWCPR